MKPVSFDLRLSFQSNDRHRAAQEGLLEFWNALECDHHAYHIFVQNNKSSLWSIAHSPMQYPVAYNRFVVLMWWQNVYSSRSPIPKFDLLVIFSVPQCTITMWFFHSQMHQGVHSLKWNSINLMSLCYRSQIQLYSTTSTKRLSLNIGWTWTKTKNKRNILFTAHLLFWWVSFFSTSM